MIKLTNKHNNQCTVLIIIICTLGNMFPSLKVPQMRPVTILALSASSGSRVSGFDSWRLSSFCQATLSLVMRWRHLSTVTTSYRESVSSAPKSTPACNQHSIINIIIFFRWCSLCITGNHVNEPDHNFQIHNYFTTSFSAKIMFQ